MLPLARFRLLIVTLEGIKLWPNAESLRGDARGGVLTGAGNFDRADCTRCSNLCICAVRLRICVKDVELGGLRVVAGALLRTFRMTEGVASLLRAGVGAADPGPLELRRFPDGILVAGLGVVLESPDGSLSLLLGWLMGVLATGFVVAEASDIGGDGGVGVSETVSTVETDLVSGGVLIIGDEAAELYDASGSNAGELGAVISVDKEGSWRFRNLSCVISASILRSESSSRRRCVSIRRLSLSFSPTFISSSNMTPRSIATLYLDSRSSKDEVVFRACLSKSSFATSISLNLSC